MLRIYVIGIGLLASPLASAHAELPKGHYGWMAELAGHCWEGTTADGKKIDVQCYSEQYGEYLRGTIEIFAPKPGGRPYLGDSVFTWDPKSSRMTFHYWASGGNSGTSTGFLEGNRIIFDNPPSTDPSVPKGRAVWERLSPAAYRVTQQQQREDEWRDQLSVTYAKVEARAAVTSEACKTPAHRAFDFWLGEWDIYVTGKDQPVGQSSIRLEDRGCVIVEQWAGRLGPPSGRSLNSYDPKLGRWEQFWADADGDSTHYIGRATPTGMIFTAEHDHAPGEPGPVTNRMVFTRLENGLRQVGTISRDGKSWETRYDLTYKRRD